MTRCLFCGHIRTDFELNCPKCGSFYSTMGYEFSEEKSEDENEVKPKKKKAVFSENPTHYCRAKMNTSKPYFFIVGTIATAIITVVFL